MFARASLVLAACLKQAAGDCPSGDKAFPSHLVGQGKISYAGQFDITYYETYKIIDYTPSARKYNEQYHPLESLRGQAIPPMVLYQCGTTRPASGDPGIDSSELRFFEIPIEKATVGWGGPATFFDMLSITEKIHLIDLQYIAPPCLQLMEYCTPGLHIKARNSSRELSPEYAAAAAETQAVFTNSFGTGWAGDPQTDVPIEISFDPGALHRAEWVKLIAAFFNEEALAEQIFDTIETDFHALEAMGAQLQTHSDSPYGGVIPRVIFVDATSSTNRISNRYHMAEVAAAAGALLVEMPAEAPTGCTFSTDNDGSKRMNCDNDDADGLASFKYYLSQADIIINQDRGSPTHAAENQKSIEEAYKITADGVKALEASPQNVYHPDRVVSDDDGAEGSMGNPWLTMAQAQPQKYLADMLEVIWGDLFESPCGLSFMRRYENPHVQTHIGHDDCPLYSDDDNHDCSGIHTRMHDVPQCAVGATVAAPSTSPNNEVSSATATSVWLSSAAAAFSML